MLIDPGTMAFAMNLIGKYIVPTDWVNNPATTACTLRGSSSPVRYYNSSAYHSAPAAATATGRAPAVAAPGPGRRAPGGYARPGGHGRLPLCTDLPTLSPCSSSFCKQADCEGAEGGLQDFRLIMQLDQPVSGIDQVQVAINTADNWATSHPMITCTPDKYATPQQHEITQVLNVNLK